MFGIAILRVRVRACVCVCKVRFVRGKEGWVVRGAKKGLGTMRHEVALASVSSSERNLADSITMLHIREVGSVQELAPLTSDT